MAEVLDEFGRNDTVYPWRHWFDGRPWRLVQGEDFERSSVSFRCTAYAAAKQRGGRVRTRLVDRGLIIQYQPPGSDEPLL
jgi:hypothetical protein